MKSLLLTAFALITMQLESAYLFSQATRTSVANGNWLSPATWDCVCIPMPGENIVVNHSITLDTSWYSTAAITVNSTGTLTEGSSLRQWAVTDGTFINNGYVNISRVSVTGGSFTNNDSLRMNLAFYVSSSFNNNGDIFDVDSFSNDGIFVNNASAIINCTLYSNLDSIINNGTINAFAHTNLSKSYNNGILNFTDYTNTATFVNTTTVSLSNFTNTATGTAVNKSAFNATNDFLNIGKFTNDASGSVIVGSDFANADSSSAFAHFINDGFFQAGDNWLNIDSVSGSGTFCVNDSTANTGILSGSFDFCDLTPPAQPPYIDWNPGTISPVITFCTKSCNSGFNGMAEFDGLSVFPNPCNNYFKIVNPVENTKYELKVYNLFGQAVLHSEITPEVSPSSRGIDVSGLQSGIYFIELKAGDMVHCEKICIQKF